MIGKFVIWSAGAQSRQVSHMISDTEAFCGDAGCRGCAERHPPLMANNACKKRGTNSQLLGWCPYVPSCVRVSFLRDIKAFNMIHQQAHIATLSLKLSAQCAS